MDENALNGALLRIPAAAKIAGQSERAIYSWISRGIIPADLVIRAGRSLHIRRGPFLVWLGAASITGDQPREGGVGS